MCLLLVIFLTSYDVNFRRFFGSNFGCFIVSWVVPAILQIARYDVRSSSACVMMRKYEVVVLVLLHDANEQRKWWWYDIMVTTWLLLQIVVLYTTMWYILIITTQQEFCWRSYDKWLWMKLKLSVTVVCHCLQYCIYYFQWYGTVAHGNSLWRLHSSIIIHHRRHHNNNE